MRKPNTQECAYYGRKLGNVICDDIKTSIGTVCIGSDNDDQIYFGESLEDGEEMLKERVTITVMHDGDVVNGVTQEHEIEVDLEDVLRFAAKHCRGIYERVLKEVKPANDGLDIDGSLRGAK